METFTDIYSPFNAEELALLPPEMKNEARWVCWGGDKIPVSVLPSRNGTHYGIDVTKSNNWGTFDNAIAAIGQTCHIKSTGERFHIVGVGFVVGDGWFCVDMDGGKNHQGKENVPEEVIADAIQILDTYVESSVSGCGYHIFGKCDFSVFAERNKPHRGPDGLPVPDSYEIELFTRHKFIAITGRWVPRSSGNAKDCTAAAREFYNKYVYNDYQKDELRRKNKRTRVATNNPVNVDDATQMFLLNYREILAASDSSNFKRGGPGVKLASGEYSWIAAVKAMQEIGIPESDIIDWCRRGSNFKSEKDVQDVLNKHSKPRAASVAGIIMDAKAHGWTCPPEKRTGAYKDNSCNYDACSKIPKGQRNTTLKKFASRLVKRFGWNDKTHELFLFEASKIDPPLPENELESIWKNAYKFEKKLSLQPDYIPPDQYNHEIPAGPAGFMIPEDYSDIGEAKILHREYGHELAFNAATDFLHYDGTVWKESKEEAFGAIMEFLDLQLVDAEFLVFSAKQAFLNAGGNEVTLSGGKNSSTDLSENLLELLQAYAQAINYQSFVMRRRNAKYITSTMTVVKPLVSIELSTLNHDPFLLNTPQASYRLTDGLDGKQEHRWDDYCTKCTSVEPGNKGKELWLDTLNKTFQNDQELIDYVQEVVGLAAIGEVYMEAMIIAYGEGRNGKSTFWNTISRVLGSYSGDVSADTLTVGCRRNVKPELAELKGVRLALAKELEEGMRLNTSIVKQLTSTDQIFGEKKFCQPAHFTPSHTLVLYTNHLPRVGAMDEGTWRRLIVIPFNAVFTGKDDIKNYADYLYENAGPFILSWIIDGARRIIQKNYHLSNPGIVKDAIGDYRSDNDWFDEFFTECCEADESYSTKSGVLYATYQTFCKQTGDFTRTTTEFYNVLSSKGYFKKRTNKGVIIYGLRLKAEFQVP